MNRLHLGLLSVSLVGLLSACDQSRSFANEAQAAARPTAAPAPAPAPEPTTVTSGVCAGKAPGDHACDGEKLVRCDDLAGKTTEEKACDALSKCDAEKVACEPACPAGEVYVPPTPEGGFTMGSAEQGSRDKPHKVVLSQPFCMDATETTVAAYKQCVQKRGCTPPRASNEGR